MRYRAIWLQPDPADNYLSLPSMTARQALHVLVKAVGNRFDLRNPFTAKTEDIRPARTALDRRSLIVRRAQRPACRRENESNQSNANSHQRASSQVNSIRLPKDS